MKQRRCTVMALPAANVPRYRKIPSTFKMCIRDRFKAAEPHVGLVDQRRRLQGMARTLPPQLPLRDRAQFGVNRIDQPVTRSQVTLPPCGKPRRELSVHGFESSSAPTHCARGQAAPLLLRSPGAMIAGRQGDSA